MSYLTSVSILLSLYMCTMYITLYTVMSRDMRIGESGRSGRYRRKDATEWWRGITLLVFQHCLCSRWRSNQIVSRTTALGWFLPLQRRQGWGLRLVVAWVGYPRLGLGGRQLWRGWGKEEEREERRGKGRWYIGSKGREEGEKERGREEGEREGRAKKKDVQY